MIKTKCKHNRVELEKEEYRNDATLKQIYICSNCDRQTIYIYEIKECYDIKGKNETEYKTTTEHKEKLNNMHVAKQLILKALRDTPSAQKSGGVSI